MQSIDSYIPITRAKALLLDLIRGIRDHDTTVAITRNGVPEAVMISMDRFDGLLETIEVLADEKAMASIRRSIAQADTNQWVEAEGLLADE